ncbi:hypothetical protein ACIPSE_45465 [Streptomyces sp. NPDC090106]|uniref:hypothetical protein n=1 Tax=Streptomyces sp. NPDC090106 TaxID=3365946 RepID=UPI003810156B
MDIKALDIDGFLFTIPSPGNDPGTARFELVVSLTDDLEDDVTWSCTTSDPRIAHALLTDINPGDLLHVSGFLTEFDDPDRPDRLLVEALEVLAPAPARDLPEMVLDWHGDYIVVFDAGIETVPVFTAAGQWVGTAESPDTIGTLIEIHERVNGTGE